MWENWIIASYGLLSRSASGSASVCKVLSRGFGATRSSHGLQGGVQRFPERRDRVRRLPERGQSGVLQVQLSHLLFGSRAEYWVRLCSITRKAFCAEAAGTGAGRGMHSLMRASVRGHNDNGRYKTLQILRVRTNHHLHSIGQQSGTTRKHLHWQLG